MSLDNKETTVPELWARALEELADAPLFNVATGESTRFMNYRTSSFYRRASRVALALGEHLGNEPGMRVVILSETAHDLIMCLHGALLAGLVAVPVSLDLPDNIVVGLINNSAATTVVFGFEAAARVATLFARLPSVKHWVAAGGTTRASLGGGISRLDDLVSAVTGEELDLEGMARTVKEREASALLVLTRGGQGAPRGVEFTHAQMIAAARHACEAMEPAQKSDSSLSDEPLGVGSLLPLKSFATLAFCGLAPLLSRYSGVLGPPFDPREFWDHVNVQELRRVIIDQRHLRSIVLRGKPKNWGAVKNLRVLVLPSGPVSARLVDDFVTTFETPLHVAYFQTEAGGVMSVARYERAGSAAAQGEVEWLAPSGALLGGINLDVRDDGGEERPEGSSGEIVVRSPASMAGYAATPSGDAFRGGGAGLHTGDLGYFIRRRGKRELVVIGRSKEIVYRAGEPVHLGLIEAALAEIRGVQWCRVVGFQNEAVGAEIGALIIQNRAANLTEPSVLEELRTRLSGNYLPRLVLFITGEPPTTNEEIQARFHVFSRQSF